MNHTPEPWEWHEGHVPDCQSQIYDTDGRTIAVFYNDEGGHNAERATNCVNALAGRNPEALARVEVAIEAVMKKHDEHAAACNFARCGCDYCSGLRAALAAFRGEVQP